VHLLEMRKIIDEFQPHVVIIDPVSNLTNVGTADDAKFMLTRLIDYLKILGITTLCTSLTESGGDGNSGIGIGIGMGISSLMDTWIKLSSLDNGSEINLRISIVKSRGMAHSNQIREFLITNQGIEILDAYLGQAGGLLMGSARAVQEAKERNEEIVYLQEAERKKVELENRLKSLDTQIIALRSEYDRKEEELETINKEEKLRRESVEGNR